MPPDPYIILTVLRNLRVGISRREKELHDKIACALLAADVRFTREAWLDPDDKTSRVDFLCDGGIVIEVKRGKPNSTTLAEQVERYAAFPNVAMIIMVIEGNVFDPIESANGKPVHYVPMHKAWGISI